MRMCLTPRCSNTTAGTYCETCQPSAARPSSAERGYGPRWRRYTRSFLAKPENQHCVCGCQQRADTVDHITAVRGPDDPRFWDPTNHQAMTGDCHRAKTNRHDGGFGNPKRPIAEARA